MMRTVALAGLLAAAAVPAGAATIINGSFETGTFAGWTLTTSGGLTGSTIVSNTEADAGLYSARFRTATGNFRIISQDVATNVGQNYILRYSLLNQGATAFDTLDVTTGGTTISYADRAPFGWTPFTQAFQATSTSTLIRFAVRHTGGTTGNFLYLDKVSLSVPEPTTWAMLIAGFGMVGLASRRRRTSLAA